MLGAREGVQERGLGSPERKRLLQKLRRAGEISPTEVSLSERRQDLVAVLDFGVDGLEQGHDSLVVPLLERESSQLLPREPELRVLLQSALESLACSRGLVPRQILLPEHRGDEPGNFRADLRRRGARERPRDRSSRGNGEGRGCLPP